MTVNLFPFGDIDLKNNYSVKNAVIVSAYTIEVGYSLKFNGQEITGISTGTNDNDKITTKGYVDDSISSMDSSKWEEDGADTITPKDDKFMRSKRVVMSEAGTTYFEYDEIEQKLFLYVKGIKRGEWR